MKIRLKFVEKTNKKIRKKIRKNWKKSGKNQEENNGKFSRLEIKKIEETLPIFVKIQF